MREETVQHGYGKSALCHTSVAAFLTGGGDVGCREALRTDSGMDLSSTAQVVGTRRLKASAAMTAMMAGRLMTSTLAHP